MIVYTYTYILVNICTYVDTDTCTFEVNKQTQSFSYVSD